MKKEFNPWDHNQQEKETWRDYIWTTCVFLGLTALLLYIFL